MLGYNEAVGIKKIIKRESAQYAGSLYYKHTLLRVLDAILIFGQLREGKRLKFV